MSKDDDREAISLEELAYAGLVQSEAITRLLIEKGIFTKEQFYDEVRAVKEEMQQVSGQ